MKKFFLLLFILSILTYAWLSIQKLYFLSALMPHFTIFSLAMYFIYEKNLRFTLNKIGIPGNIKNSLKYAIIAFLATIAILILVNIIFSSQSAQTDAQRVSVLINKLPLYLLIFAIVFAPISEELFFRALLISVISKRFGSMIGIVAPAILFGLVHFTYGSKLEILVTFLIGLLFGYIYKKSNSILPTIIAHAIYNALAIGLIKSIA